MSKAKQMMEAYQKIADQPFDVGPNTQSESENEDEQVDEVNSEKEVEVTAKRDGGKNTIKHWKKTKRSDDFEVHIFDEDKEKEKEEKEVENQNKTQNEEEDEEEEEPEQLDVKKRKLAKKNLFGSAAAAAEKEDSFKTPPNLIKPKASGIDKAPAKRKIASNKAGSKKFDNSQDIEKANNSVLSPSTVDIDGSDASD